MSPLVIPGVTKMTYQLFITWLPGWRHEHLTMPLFWDQQHPLCPAPMPIPRGGVLNQSHNEKSGLKERTV